jgi:hypothetical protein
LSTDAGTRLAVKRFVHAVFLAVLHFERRFDPFFRPAWDALFREPSAAILQWLINALRRDDRLALAEERPIAGESEALDSIIIDMGTYMRTHWTPGNYQRAGNTKTHGIVRAEFVVRDDLPERLKKGIFAGPQSYKAYVRFSGPGPDWPADVDDVGFMSCTVKLMGVPGPKVFDDERFTQDFLTVTTPTFVTPDVTANAQLQRELRDSTEFFYFCNVARPHLLDALMQGLWNKTQSSPLEAQYWSCTPYLLGEGQAMQYSIRTTLTTRTRIPRLPLRPPDDYLREAMAATLARGGVDLDFLIQLQTDAYRMPIENAAVRWPLRLSPYVKAATIRIPAQTFDSAAQLAFANVLRYSPWHCVPEHRPLGNQNRVRRRMYTALANLRQLMNAAPHYEPTGDETFG